MSSSPQSAMLSVYDGQRCLGHIIAWGKRRFEAFDANDSSLGTADAVHAVHLLQGQR